MDYLADLKYHFRPKKGWMNDPNGLVFFNGYYHLFFQYDPDNEIPGRQATKWGHARTKDFIVWEELPIAIRPEAPYDKDGCWSGTAIVKDNILYIFYASCCADSQASQTISIAYSDDGINFKKYENNPIIRTYPAEGSHDFRDSAVMKANGKYYLVVASGKPEKNEGNLLSYESEDLLNWKYNGVAAEWGNAVFCECPSFMKYDDRFMLATSVMVHIPDIHFFTVMCGDFDGTHFKFQTKGDFQHGPDAYAGQVFLDDKGRHILISWIPGWLYNGFAERSISAMSVPMELTEKNGKIYCYPVEEVRHLLKDSDPLVKITDDGFIVEREKRDNVIHKGKINDIKIIRDGYILEIFINGGEDVYSLIIC